MSLSADAIDTLNARFHHAHPTDIVRWAADTFGPGLLMTSSFGAESMCSIHLANSAMPGIRIVVVNTGYLFPETVAFMEAMRQRFRLNIVEYRPRHDPIAWLTIHGEPDPMRRNNVDACCAANKNEAFDRAMKEQAPAAWLRGVRADQSETRANMNVVQWSKRNACWAISPILHWNNREIHRYMREHDLPYHPLWEKGFTSIGCCPETCTRPMGGGGEDASGRGGRWAGLAKKECGIHLEGESGH